VRKVLVLLISFVALVMGGCATMEQSGSGLGPTLGGAAHGGGVAYLNNGEKLTIDAQGAIQGRCQLCQDREGDLASCKSLAASKGIELCPEMLNISVPRGPLMCPVVAGPHAGSDVPYGSAGYTCYLIGAAQCMCVG